MKIFVTGAGGYVGGLIAARFAQSGHSVRGLIRNPSRAEELRSFRIEPVIGNLDDSALLAAEAARADANHRTKYSTRRHRLPPCPTGRHESGSTH